MMIQVQKNTEKKETITKYCEDIRQGVFNQVEEIMKFRSYKTKMLCLFSLIDSFAQEKAEYKGENKEAFCCFLRNYSNEGVLDWIDPITLFYDVEGILNSKELLTELQEGNEYIIGDESILALCESIKGDLENSLDESSLQKYLNRHKICELLYRLRNKVTHEVMPMSWVGAERESKNELPFYENVARFYSGYDKDNDENAWVLCVPVGFVRDLLFKCCDNYLKECIEECKWPFGNTGLSRRHVLSWYDVPLKK